jgi:hypothetical protein
MQSLAVGRDSALRSARLTSALEIGSKLTWALVPTTVTWTEGLYSGGTPEGSARASVGAWTEILRFLDDHLGARGSTS